MCGVTNPAHVAYLRDDTAVAADRKDFMQVSGLPVVTGNGLRNRRLRRFDKTVSVQFIGLIQGGRKERERSARLYG